MSCVFSLSEYPHISHNIICKPICINSPHLTFLNRILGEQYLLARGKTMASLGVTAYSVAVSLLLVAILLPAIATMALPVAGLISELSLFVLLLGLLHKHKEILVRPLLPALALAAGGSTVTVACVLTFDPLVSIFLSLVIPLTLLVLGYRLVMDAPERAMLRDMIHRGKAALIRRRGQ